VPARLTCLHRFNHGFRSAARRVCRTPTRDKEEGFFCQTRHEDRKMDECRVSGKCIHSFRACGALRHHVLHVTIGLSPSHRGGSGTVPAFIRGRQFAGMRVRELDPVARTFSTKAGSVNVTMYTTGGRVGNSVGTLTSVTGAKPCRSCRTRASPVTPAASSRCVVTGTRYGNPSAPGHKTPAGAGLRQRDKPSFGPALLSSISYFKVEIPGRAGAKFKKHTARLLIPRKRKGGSMTLGIGARFSLLRHNV